MQKKLPGSAVSPQEVISMIKDLERSLTSDRQIFQLRLLDQGQTFSGEGALWYCRPDSLKLSVYGPPYSTLYLDLLRLGDSLQIALPKRNEVIRTRTSEYSPPAAARLGAAESFVQLFDAEFQGGLTGIFSISSYQSSEIKTIASKDNFLYRLRFTDGSATCEFVYDQTIKSVVGFIRYQQGRKSREILRSDFRQIDHRWRPRKITFRDYVADREITLRIKKEEIDSGFSREIFAKRLAEISN